MKSYFYSHKKEFRILIFILVIGLAAFMLFFRLGDSRLQNWDEQLYSDTIKETLASGNPFILRYQGTYFFEKPPLWFYVTEVPASVFGVNNTTVRLTNAVSASVILLLVFLIVKRKTNETAGIIAVLSLLAVQQNFIMNPAGWFGTHNFRSADLDYFQIMFFVLAFYLIPFIKKRKSVIYLISFILGLAVLAKGFFTLFPLAIIFVYLFIKRKEFKLNIRSFIISALVFLITVLPWHIWMMVQYGKEFIDSYFIKNMVNRSATILEGHAYPFYVYFKNFIDPRFNIMCAVFISAVSYFILKLRKNFNFDYLYPILMFAGTMIFFTMVSTKISWYILPIFPFLAMLTGYFFNLIKTYKKIYIIFIIVFSALFFIGIANSINMIILQSQNLYLGS